MEPDVKDNRKVKLSCRNVWKVYGSQPEQFFNSLNGSVDDANSHAEKIRNDGHIVANADVSFDVHAGEIFVIMGLSGSGKSTIVRCLSRLVEPTAGEIILDGEDLLRKSDTELIDIRRHKMGMVFQSFGLMPHLNVIDNIAFPLKLQGKPENERYKQAERVIELVGLQGRENNYPKELSGGQQQRVGIARSLAVEPEIWFLDEPFSALDPLIRKQMQDEFLRIQSKLKKSIVQIGRPVDLILNPVDDYIRDFTLDVPWETILTAADIAEPSDEPLEGLGRVAEDTLIEKLLHYLGESDRGVVVEAKDGSVLGIATARGVVKALSAGSGPDQSSVKA